MLFQGKERRLSQKGLALLYFLALEGPTSRARLAELLYGHGAALQNLRVEIHRLAKALGREVFPKGQDPLVLPDWIRLEVMGEGEVLAGLEGVGGLADWVLGVRERYHVPREAAGRGRLLGELSSLRPPFLLVLKGRLGAGQRAFAQALAGVLGLPFHETLRPEGLVYLVPPYPEVPLKDLLRSRALLVLRLDPGEEPRFFLELRAHYPADRLRVLALPLLDWLEAKGGVLAGVPFPEGARAYFHAGGQPEWIPDWLACPQGPKRPLAQLRLQTRLLSEPARLALERLSVAPGRIPEEVLDALEALPYLEELERKGFLVYQEGYRFAAEAERRLLYASLDQGRRHELHERAATALAFSGRLKEEALHRLALGERVGEGFFFRTTGWKGRPLGRGRERVLLPRGHGGLSLGEEGFALGLLEWDQEAWLDLEPLEEALVLEVAGEAYSPEGPPGLFLEVRGPKAKGFVRLEGVFRRRFLLAPGPWGLRFLGLGVAEFALRAFLPRPGEAEVWELTPEEVKKEGEDEGKEEGGGQGNVHL
ncbi:hypothetical protein [Thermus arciformis]|uniref:hypothetical protein n=1 Tax=Thermus arciformis TaxID=482827 RepID=UPI001F4A1489|nr:hypothetical protein [Thermus arciformis]